MPITVENLVSREVHYCVSFLVSTLAQGYGALDSSTADLTDAAEQAFVLCSPIDDWEEAAMQEGWTLHHVESDRALVFVNADGLENYNTTWGELCDECDIEPHQREVYEHWIVSDWLADRLAEKGEKVDKDFAGLIVWARTTTGQGIASDSVIEAIHADLVREA